MEHHDVENRDSSYEDRDIYANPSQSVGWAPLDSSNSAAAVGKMDTPAAPTNCAVLRVLSLAREESVG